MKGGEVGVTYKRGNILISVEQVDGFGKNPSLWVGTKNPNELLKVASFGSSDKAAVFCKWLEHLLRLNSIDEGEKQDG